MQEKTSFIGSGDLNYFRSYLDHVAEEEEDEDDELPDETSNKLITVSSQQPTNGILDSIREDLGKMMQGIRYSTDEERLLEPEHKDSMSNGTIPTLNLSTNPPNSQAHSLKKTWQSPFSLSARQARTSEFNDDPLLDKNYSLTKCRKVSVVVRVCCTTQGHEKVPWEDNDNICIYPNRCSTDDDTEEKEEEGDDEYETPVVEESEQIILVNPKSFGKLLPTTVTVEVCIYPFHFMVQEMKSKKKTYILLLVTYYYSRRRGC